MDLEMPKYWKKMFKFPYVHGAENQHNSIYLIVTFKLKRTLFLNKSYSVLCNMESRKAKVLIEEARERGWISNTIPNCSLGDRPEGYPKCGVEGYWIEIFPKEKKE